MKTKWRCECCWVPMKARRIRVPPEVLHWRGFLLCRGCLGDVIAWNQAQREPELKHPPICRCRFCVGPQLPF